MSRRAWGEWLDRVDGGAQAEERRRSLIVRFEGGRRSQPYRCRHMVVTVGGEQCFICGLDLSGTTWQEAWNRTGPQAPSRPLPSEHGIGAVVIRTGEGERDE